MAFVPDYSKKLFTIEIDVYDNSSVFNVKGDHKATYVEVIGALNTVIFSLMVDQQSMNIERYIALKKEQQSLIKTTKNKTKKR